MSRFFLLPFFSLFLALIVFASPSFAEGFNSSPGYDLPIGSGGNTFMWVKPSGLVGIGTSQPQNTLDVAGGIKFGYADLCDGNHYGTMRYNPSTTFMEYCNPQGWVPLKGGAFAYGGQYSYLNGAMCYISNPATGECSCPSGYSSHSATSGMIGPGMALFLYVCTY